MGIRLAQIGIVAFTLVFAGCDQASVGGYTSASEILSSPGQYEGKEVKVRGVARAVTKMPFVDLRTFLLERDGVDLLIITEGSLPGEGDEVALRGVVHSAAIMDGQALGLRVREVERF